MPYVSDWKPTKPEAPDYKCRNCESDNIWYREWESSDGGHEDIKYECRNCNCTWWVEGSDA